MNDSNTIVAVATPVGVGALAVIRVSGSGSFSIISKIVKQKGKFEKAPARYNLLYLAIDNNGEILDEITATKYRNPHSYTGEDTVEIISHGGYYTVKKILEEIIKNGAHVAEPGEFSKRAFFNGKIDLYKAEAIKAIIDSKSDVEYSLAIKSFGDDYQKSINNWKNEIINEIVVIDAEIEFGEENQITTNDKSNVVKIVKSLEKEIEKLSQIQVISKGFTVVLVGLTNAGKTTIFNKLLGYNRGIVSEFDGTTRDTISEKIRINNHEVTIIDTAGIRETQESIESEGISRSIKEMQNANLILWITDVSKKVTEEEIRWLNKTGKKTVLILNKTDKKFHASKIKLEDIKEIIKTNHEDGKSTETVYKKIEEKIVAFKKDNSLSDVLINQRQKEIAVSIVAQLKNAMEHWMQKEISVMYLKKALKLFDSILGKNCDDEIVNRIFQNFCIGK